MVFRNGPCEGKKPDGSNCTEVGAADPHNKMCGPHRDQALRKAKKAFEKLDAPEATGFAQLAQDMLDKEVEIDLPFLREQYLKF